MMERLQRGTRGDKRACPLCLNEKDLTPVCKRLKHTRGVDVPKSLIQKKNLFVEGEECLSTKRARKKGGGGEDCC